MILKTENVLYGVFNLFFSLIGIKIVFLRKEIEYTTS